MIGTKPRFIFGYLFSLGIVAVGVILGTVFWLTARLDQLEQKGVENVVELMVTEKVERVKASTADYAHWNLAYELVIGNDSEGLHDNLGSGATESDLFDQIVILNSNSKITHVYDSTGTVGSPAEFDLQSILPFLAKLKETTPADYITVSGIGLVNGTYGAIAATRITPDYLANSASARLPVMLGINLFNEDALQAIARLTQGTGYAITPIGNPPADPGIELVGPYGAPVAQLVWTHNQAGTALRMEIMPGLLLVCFGIFGICLFAARYFHQQSKALERAMTVASTDQLTGLLNRSGLDEALRAPKVKARVDAGHVAVIYLDLNGFKQLNDAYGHEDGDQALRITAERLRNAVRPHDLVVRLGGDEFICMVFDQVPGAAARAVSDRILINHIGPIHFAAHEEVLTASVGVALGEPGLAWETLLVRADKAMYEAKRRKLGTAVFHEAGNRSTGRTEKTGATFAA
ncbi:diguanylate cyclase domain-containing protein [Hoeflea sp.]|uniref:diguanylate cyclase domain-containing protein n=1 Tax=Hoeflea sp. TaxID=1940281 RepID=UPI003A91A138